jgi:two-component system CheB/CheR fusion protein
VGDEADKIGASDSGQLGHIVAIGASAGGLDALEKLFSTLPPDTGAAFLVIQHLSPDHKSMMANLLSRHTSMPVLVAEQDMPVEPNHVYLIPPGAIMHMGDGYLRLTPKNPRTLTLPIDVFFTSMARQYGDRSVGIVLSGTGSDGTRGAAAINEAGGLLIAQSPENAKFDGMPRSVIATGLVDAILPVEEIAQRLQAHLLKQPPHRTDQPSEIAPRSATLSPEAALSGIMHLLLQLGGVDFQEYKPGTVLRRIERRIAVRQAGSIQDYLDLLSEDRNEVMLLRRELLIPVTSFFRDADAYETLARQVIEPIVARKQAGETIRVWVAGVSTGEEAYSIAMLFLEAFEQIRRWPSLKIFATDVEQQNIETAGAGAYPESIAAEVSPQQLERFFVKRGSTFVVKNELRQCIVFARHNLLSDPPFTKMDLVSCRNTLIYFRAAAQERALKRLHYALNQHGYLFLGSSESLGPIQHDFTPISARHKIWQVLHPMTLPLELARATSTSSVLTHSPSVAVHARGLRHRHNAVDMGLAALLRAFAPPAAILVNARHELVHSYGDVHRVLQLKEGYASLELNRILPEKLIPVASALLYKCNREKTSVMSDAVQLRADESGSERYRLSAWPAGELEGEPLTLLAFERLSSSDQSTTVSVVDVDAETTERIEVLERELAATRENLQATIEELETSNEELQSTNEELMASNEELQSSNEELQSVNEELNTINAEYQEKIDVLNRLNADLDSMAKAVSAGTVFVDQDLNLTRFSPDAAHIFKLRNSDIGRRLDDLAHQLEYPELIGDLQTTLQTNSKIERDVRGLNGRHYFVRMVPYSVPSSSARGVVASFLDVTAMHDVARLQKIMDALAEHIAVLDSKGTITLVNAAWRRFAMENGDPDLTHTGPGVNYLTACRVSPALDDPSADRAARGIKDVLNGRQRHFTMEYPCNSPTEERWFVMHVSAIDGENAGAVVSHVNITAWRYQQSKA